MSAIISTFFTSDGDPALALSPTLRIWEITETADVLVITDASMIEVGDGFYKYIFTTYDSNKNYAIRTFGGLQLLPHERYSVGELEEELTTIREAVWDATATSHVDVGSTGLYLNQTNTNVEQLVLDSIQIQALLALLVKYERNRTRIDKIAKTLTVYDDDGITPLTVFDLKDGTGTGSVAEVCERDPQ